MSDPSLEIIGAEVFEFGHHGYTTSIWQDEDYTHIYQYINIYILIYIYIYIYVYVYVYIYISSSAGFF